MAAPRKKTGRPKKSQADAKSALFRIRLTSDDKALLDRAAKSQDLDTSTWARAELLKLARKLLETQPGDP